MTAYVIRRVLWLLPVLFVVSLITFLLMHAAPGTPFQEKVWSALLTIPYGQTLSYEDLAGKVGAPGAQRAVGMVAPSGEGQQDRHGGAQLRTT